MNLSDLDTLLDKMPAMVRLNPVSLAFLERPVTLYDTAREMALALDACSAIVPARWLTLDIDGHFSCRFPQVSCDHEPFTPDLNRVLFEHYDRVGHHMLTQDRIAERIVSQSTGLDTVVLLLLDGLSYDDCRAWPNVEPCLTALPSMTRVCFPAIVNKPPVASQLFTRGFNRRMGFTYWERKDNKLTDVLFQTIGNMREIQAGFGEIVTCLKNTPDLRQSYIQIVRSALDDYADGIRVPVPRDILVQQLWHDITAVADVLRERGLRAAIYAVADHGLLWKDQGHVFEVVAHDRGGLRYAPTKPPDSRGRWVTLGAERFWVLDYPQLRRDFHKDEQGTHGGISFEECIVPFVTLEVRPDA